ncbi:S1/P1 Nuclease [Phenylobacterium sp.]|jgi:hypothetical protein|uniref:S1/P1 Nuclease n=1 Tax=Phenylobacterium sp. TaxID=1871053 RepID=UPI003782E9E8
MTRLVAGLVAALLTTAPAPALAWGNTGHRMVGQEAMRALPAEIPAFLRTRQAIEDVGELSREPDRSKAAGKIHDHDRDAAHFVDLDETGRVLGGPPFLPLPTTKADYETALRAAGLDMWKAGYLPYAMIDARQQLALDFAYWRILQAAEANPKWRGHRAWYRADRLRREASILRTIGELSHYVADGSQPMHVSVHFNGWGDYPNPQGYSTARLHGPFESDLVQRRVDQREVRTHLRPLRLCDCSPEQRTTDYLRTSLAEVIPFYELEKAGGLRDDDPRGPAFATRLLAVGASELRDVVVEAWRASAGMKVGWRPVAVADVVSGKTEPYSSLYGVD